MTVRLAAGDGTPLAVARWAPPGRPVGAVVLVHGLGEHLGRYHALAGRLAAGGRLVLGADLRGHGGSGGARGHVERFDDYLDDLALVLGAAREGAGGRPRVLVGHSLGALVALRFVETRGAGGLAGLVLSGIGLAPTVAVPWWKRVVGRVGDRVCPRVPFDNEIDPRGLASDPAVGEAFRTDPLAHRVVTPRWFRQFERARARALADAARVRLPVLILHGRDDPIVSWRGAEALARAMTSADVTLRVYPGSRHEVFNDPAATALADLEAWLAAVEARRRAPAAGAC
jgi:acylglycerol lipase